MKIVTELHYFQYFTPVFLVNNSLAIRLKVKNIIGVILVSKI